jgi:hypothetical protein
MHTPSVIYLLYKQLFTLQSKSACFNNKKPNTPSFIIEINVFDMTNVAICSTDDIVLYIVKGA